jgi:hypothetical protein
MSGNLVSFSFLGGLCRLFSFGGKRGFGLSGG